MKKRRKLICISIIVLILIIIIFKGNKNKKFQDELIFFKIFSLAQKQENNTLTTKEGTTSIYKFNVGYKNIDFKNIYLADTINVDTLLYGKIAPRNKRRI